MAEIKKNTNTKNTNINTGTYNNRSNIYRSTPAVKAGGSKKRGKKKRRKKSGMLGPLIGMLFGSGTVALLLLVVLLIEAVGKTGKVSASTDVTDSHGRHYSADEEYINIDAESFLGYIGQSYTLSLSANPVELVESVVWSSNNEDAVIVDDRGQIFLVGEGIAAVTATAGQYSSAIVVEVVKNTGDTGNMGFDTVGPNGNKNNSDSDTAAEESQPVQNETDTTAWDGQNGGNIATDAADTTQTATTGEVNGGDNAGIVETTTQETAHDHSQDSSTEETTTEFVPPTTTAAGAIDTAEMFSVLSSAGFSQYLPNASIYEVDGEYYGEIIVESDSVHIYIKKRSGQFDMAIRGALAYLLPDTSESVWNVYTTLSRDKTINSDGRKVRFIMPATNAHSQIIVYNP